MTESLAFKAIRKFETKVGPVSIGILRGSRVGEHVPYLEMFGLLDALNSSGIGARMVRPAVADAVLAGDKDNWKFFADNGCRIFPTSVLAMYRAPGTAFGRDSIVSHTEHKDAPKLLCRATQWARWKDVVVTREAAACDFIETAEGVLVLPRKPRPQHEKAGILPIPPKTGNYLPVNGSSTLIWEPVDAGAEGSRYVERHHGDYVGPLVRETGENGERRHVIALSCSAFERYGVVLEVPEAHVDRCAVKPGQG